MAREQTSRSKWRRSTKHGKVWQGRKVFTCPRAEIEQHERELNDDQWAFNSAFPAMKTAGVDVQPYDPAREGNAQITVTYDSDFDAFEFPIGRATLSVHGKGKSVKLTKGLDGGDLDTKPDNNGIYTEPVEPDSNIAVMHNTMVVVKTAYRQSDLHWDTIGNRIGKVCNHDMPKLAKAKKNTMKLIDAGIPKYVLSNPDDDIVPIQFIFERYRYGKEWPKTVKAQRWQKVIRAVVVLWPEEVPNHVVKYVAADGVGEGAGWTTDKDDAKVRDVVLKLKLGEPEDCVVNKFTSFSDIKALLAWRAS